MQNSKGNWAARAVLVLGVSAGAASVGAATVGCGGCYYLDSLRVDGPTCVTASTVNEPYCGDEPQFRITNQCESSLKLRDVQLYVAGASPSTLPRADLVIEPGAAAVLFGENWAETHDRREIVGEVANMAVAIRWER